MAKPRKTIITCAVTGAIHALDVGIPAGQPLEIAEAAIGAAEAGRGHRPSACLRTRGTAAPTRPRGV